jgi:TetR/AcrR family transcriptional regulator of autoinduction and epiphytic fitness
VSRALPPGQSEDEYPSDGRLLRGARTRSLIVRSYIELLASGERAPRAEQIARRAGVGMRTVYNQFRDLEDLRAEAGTLVRAQIDRYVLREVPRRTPLEERLDLFLRGRVQVLEVLAPYARSAQGRHEESAELRRQRAALVQDSERELGVAFGPELDRLSGPERAQMLHALHAASAWPAWSSLREELSLGCHPGGVGAAADPGRPAAPLTPGRPQDSRSRHGRVPSTRACCRRLAVATSGCRAARMSA